MLNDQGHLPSSKMFATGGPWGQSYKKKYLDDIRYILLQEGSSKVTLFLAVMEIVII